MNTLLPQIRFKEFKSNWSTEKLGNLFKINAGGDIHKDNFNKSKNEKFKYPVYANSLLKEGLYGYSDLYKQEANLLTVTGRGVNIGNPEVRYTRFYPIIRLIILKPKNKLSLEFFKYLIYNTKFYVESTGVPQLTAPQISKYKISFPYIEEQQKIASFLTSVDDKITLLTKKKELLEQYKKGVIQKMFSQEIRFKDDNGNDFPNWGEEKIGNISKVYQSKTISQSETTNKGYLVYGANGIIGRYHLYNHEYSQIAITCRGNTCGAVTFTQPKSWITGNAMVINFDNSDNSNKKFFYYQFSHSNLRYLITGSGQPQITGDIKNHKVSIPTFEEQNKIALFLSSLDKKIGLVDSQIDKTKEFKKGLLQQMFV